MSESNENAGTNSSTATDNNSSTTNGNVKSEDNESSQDSRAKGPTPSAPGETKLYVGNLPDNCHRDDLQALFNKYGEVSQCDRVKNYAFVHMIGDENAKKAISELDDSEFMGTHIQVQLAKSKGKPAEDECFHCGQRGHWAKDCTQRNSSGRFRRSGYGRHDRPAPYGRREGYGRPPPRDYHDFYDRRGPQGRDFGPPYRSRSPAGGGGYGRRSPDYSVGYEGYGPPRSSRNYSMGYEGYGPPRSGYGVRRY